MEENINSAEERVEESQDISGSGPGEEKIDALAILSYIGLLFLVPLLVDKDNDFRQFHAKQGMVLFFGELITPLVMIIPFLGWLVGVAMYVSWVILAVIGILNVVNGKKKELPVIGEFAHRFKI